MQQPEYQLNLCYLKQWTTAMDQVSNFNLEKSIYAREILDFCMDVFLPYDNTNAKVKFLFFHITWYTWHSSHWTQGNWTTDFFFLTWNMDCSGIKHKFQSWYRTGNVYQFLLNAPRKWRKHSPDIKSGNSRILVTISQLPILVPEPGIPTTGILVKLAHAILSEPQPAFWTVSDLSLDWVTVFFENTVIPAF